MSPHWWSTDHLEPHDEDVRIFRVEKQNYSRGAWRVLDANGQQVWRDEEFDHPNLGLTIISGPVCFDRKRDAVAWVELQGGTVAPGRPARFGFYCTECGATYQTPGAGIITCHRCGHLGLRGFERPPIRVTCPKGCDWQGWDDGGVNDDLGRHLRREH